MLARRRTSFSLRVHWGLNQGPAAARNRALRAAEGDVLVFLDDDVMPVPDLIMRHLQVHRQDSAAVVTGPMLAPPDIKLASWLEWEAVMLGKQYRAMAAGVYAPTPRQFYTANASVRREHALAVGGFDERFTRAEDVEFAFRLAGRGVRFYFVREAVVWHEPDRTFASWLRVPYEYGRHDVLMERKQVMDTVRTAFLEQRGRHLVSRALSRLCAGYPRRTGAATNVLTRLIKHRGPLAPTRVQFALCSALFNLQYWQGVADETGLNTSMWRALKKRATA
jgi:GT2 family glycosyltransferase